MKNINIVYSVQTWKEFEEKFINFTHRSEFEQILKEVPKELQTIIIAKVLCGSVCLEQQGKSTTLITKNRSFLTFTMKML